MESVVYEDSPLAEYLQGMMLWDTSNGTAETNTVSGEGVADSEITLTRVTEQSPSPTLHSFAPQGLSSGSSRFQSKIPRALQLKLPKGSTISRVHSICSVRTFIEIAEIVTHDKLARCEFTAWSDR